MSGKEEEMVFEFDKFMDDILLKEEKTQKQELDESEEPIRKLNRRYREKPKNRIVYGVKK